MARYRPGTGAGGRAPVLSQIRQFGKGSPRENGVLSVTLLWMDRIALSKCFAVCVRYSLLYVFDIRERGGEGGHFHFHFP